MADPWSVACVESESVPLLSSGTLPPTPQSSEYGAALLLTSDSESEQPAQRRRLSRAGGVVARGGAFFLMAVATISLAHREITSHRAPTMPADGSTGGAPGGTSEKVAAAATPSRRSGLGETLIEDGGDSARSRVQRSRDAGGASDDGDDGGGGASDKKKSGGGKSGGGDKGGDDDGDDDNGAGGKPGGGDKGGDDEGGDDNGASVAELAGTSYSYSYAEASTKAAVAAAQHRTAKALAVVKVFEEADVKLSATSQGTFHCAFDFAYCAAASCTRHRVTNATKKGDVEIATCACQPVKSSAMNYAQVGRSVVDRRMRADARRLLAAG